MKIVVCVKQSANGEINPFDASAYETALRIDGAEITLLSMGPEKTAQFLEGLTRLGANRAVLLCDRAFAGADTLATSYALSLAIKRLEPDLIFCGRQSVDGDTGQVGPSIAARLNYSLVTNVMSVFKNNIYKNDICKKENDICNNENDGCNNQSDVLSNSYDISYTDRLGRSGKVKKHSVLTLEKSCRLRLPSIRSRVCKVEILSADDLGADISLCGLNGSPTRVLKTFENDSDRRHVEFISPNRFLHAVETGLKNKKQITKPVFSKNKLKNIWCVGKAPFEFAQTVGENITVIDFSSAENIAEKIKKGKPDSVLWGSDINSKALAPQVAALLNTGLCADCTTLETDGEKLFMYRPACSGNIIAKIVCETKPPMATVRTAEEERKRITIGIGYGAKDCIEQIKAVSQKLNADIAATRKIVDNDYLPYEIQVGLTGRTVSPDVYIAVGISGAVHHIAGMKQSGTVIAVNPDKNAPIFSYADYGIIRTAEEVFNNNIF